MLNLQCVVSYVVRKVGQTAFISALHYLLKRDFLKSFLCSFVTQCYISTLPVIYDIRLRCTLN